MVRNRVQYAFGQIGERAGPNKAGGLPTKWSPDLVFNADQPNIIYNVPMMMGRPQNLPQEYAPSAVATWVWDPKNGPAPWPGSGPDLRVAPQAPAQQSAPASPVSSMPMATTIAPASAPKQAPSLILQPDIDAGVIKSGSDGTSKFIFLIGIVVVGAMILLLVKKMIKKPRHEPEEIIVETEVSSRFRKKRR